MQASQQTAARRSGEAEAATRALAAAQASAQALDVRAEQAVERHNGAVLHQQQAEARAAQARRTAATAAATADAARTAAAALAAAQYRGDVRPGLAGLAGLLSVRDLHAASVRREAVRSVVEETRRVEDTASAASADAGAASAAATLAATAARAATIEVTQAQQQMQAQLTAQRTEVARLAAERTTLLAQLAAAQQTSVELAAARQQALADAAARAAAEVARKAALTASDTTPDGASPYRPGDASAAVAFARAQLGRPYVWGGAGPDTYDCSGLTMRSWQRARVDLPHFAADQFARSTPLSYSRLHPGDLVFWSHDGTPQDIYHVAIYLGDDQMIEAPRTGDVVKVASLWIMGTPNFYARP
ncbi:MULTISPECIES: C40 family peptidase [Streptacidiphilus]|uniref:C40 family peptidase n=1 Tax=Streptacidiphilus cavernicola TaxID=3342716 RepID=A0ABV6UST9_9ACTN|nr:C40 family peptidase [Streptacidiphilus jeojiense]